MGYARSFRQLRTHVLCTELVDGSLDHDRALVYEALGAGRCYIAVDALAPARGFSFWASDGTVMGGQAAFDGQTLFASVPRPASLRLIRDGAVVERWKADRPGVYRVEARLRYRGRDRTWILSNPIYLR
jgi:hypothetical protein